jgi:hypothetical protein
MATFKYSYDRSVRHVAINVSTNPSYGGVKTEQEARVACARKIDGDIAELKEKFARQQTAFQEELSVLEDLRNSVYVGELPTVVLPQSAT